MRINECTHEELNYGQTNESKRHLCAHARCLLRVCAWGCVRCCVWQVEALAQQNALLLHHHEAVISHLLPSLVQVLSESCHTSHVTPDVTPAMSHLISHLPSHTWYNTFHVAPHLAPCISHLTLHVTLYLTCHALSACHTLSCTFSLQLYSFSLALAQRPPSSHPSPSYVLSFLFSFAFSLSLSFSLCLSLYGCGHNEQLTECTSLEHLLMSNLQNAHLLMSTLHSASWWTTCTLHLAGVRQAAPRSRRAPLPVSQRSTDSRQTTHFCPKFQVEPAKACWGSTWNVCIADGPIDNQ